MTIPVSLIPQVCDYLKSQVTALIALEDPNPADIAVSVGNPGSVSQNEHIVIAGGQVHREVEPFAMVGSGAGGWLKETVEIPCVVFTWANVREPETVWQRVFVLAAYLETAVRQDPSLGGLVIVAMPLTLPVPPPAETDDPVGYQCQIELTVKYEAEL